MIPYFKDSEIRNSAVIHNAILDQIKMLYVDNPEMAGELAISAIELVLTGDMSTSNTMIKALLASSKRISEVEREKYDKSVELKKNKAIVDNKLDIVAEMTLAGFTQAQIGEKLGITQQSVSRKLGVIRRDYPELLVQTSTTSVQPDTSVNSCTKGVQGCTTVVEECKDNPKALFGF
jgi:DNA-binding XRE family transcriptional regulator